MPEAAAAIAAGLLHAFSFAPGVAPWLELAALAALFLLGLRARSLRQAAFLGFCFGGGWFGAGAWWTYVSMHHHGAMSAFIAAPAAAALDAFLALFPALACALAWRLSPPLPDAAVPLARRMLAIPACWTLCEWLRSVILGGFPWIATGYAHTQGPLAGYAPVLGVYGVGLVAAAVAVLPLALAARQRRRVGASLAACAALLLLGGGWVLGAQDWSQAEGAPARVRVLQGAIPQDLKFADGGMSLAVATYRELAREAQRAPRADLVVLPESAFPGSIDELPAEAFDTVAELRARGSAVLFGAFVVEPPMRYFNSAIGLDADREAKPQRYSKAHLVPFGEFVPAGLHWFVELMNMPIGDQEAGRLGQPPMNLAGRRVAVNICFEQLFGEELLAPWSAGRGEPGILANLSNLAWFDDSVALPQFLEISRMRALEVARPMILATNTGPTALIDARGRVTARLAGQKPGVLDGEVQAMAGRTPFSRLGDTPTLLAALLAIAALVTFRAGAGPTPK